MISKTITMLVLGLVSLNAFSATMVCSKEEKCQVTYKTLAEARQVCPYLMMDETKVVQKEANGSVTVLGYVCVSKSLN